MRLKYIFTTVIILIAGCSSNINSQRLTFKNPFKYCKYVINVDKPTYPYVGKKIPMVIANKMKKLFGISNDAPTKWVFNNTFWRCMDKRVYVCFGGVNIPCIKANSNKTPTKIMSSFCLKYKNADIPAYITGHDTIYLWKCVNGKALVVKKYLTRIKGAI